MDLLGSGIGVLVAPTVSVLVPLEGKGRGHAVPVYDSRRTHASRLDLQGGGWSRKGRWCQIECRHVDRQTRVARASLGRVTRPPLGLNASAPGKANGLPVTSSAPIGRRIPHPLTTAACAWHGSPRRGSVDTQSLLGRLDWSELVAKPSTRSTSRLFRTCGLGEREWRDSSSHSTRQR
jgi:hypothetical protein